MTIGTRVLMVALVILTDLLLAPLMAAAQQAEKVYRIGYLSVRSPGMEFYFPAFRDGLRDLGYVEGKNFVIEARYADRDNRRLPSLTASLLEFKPDVIVVGGGGAALAAKRLTQSVPIVMAEATAPVERGIVENIARPEANVTGLARRTAEEFGKYLQVLKEALPNLSHVAVLWNPKGPASKIGWKMLQGPAKQLGIRLYSMEVRGVGDLEDAFKQAGDAGAEAVFVTPGPRINQKVIGGFIQRNRFPAFATSQGVLKHGALISYRSSMTDIYRRAAFFVDKILKGAKPSELPVELPTEYELVVNLKVARSLNITLPTSILLRADKVIE